MDTYDKEEREEKERDPDWEGDEDNIDKAGCRNRRGESRA